MLTISNAQPAFRQVHQIMSLFDSTSLFDLHITFVHLPHYCSTDGTPSILDPFQEIDLLPRHKSPINSRRPPILSPNCSHISVSLSSHAVYDRTIDLLLANASNPFCVRNSPFPVQVLHRPTTYACIVFCVTT